MLVAFFLKGILVGAIIAVPVGPVGVLCVRRTIFSGKLAGFLSGMGAATADAVYGIIAGFGLTFVSDWLFGYQKWLRIGGAVFLLYIGGKAFFSKESPSNKESERDPETLFKDYASTFALTITNPVTILAFLALFASVGFNGGQATLVHAGTLVFGVWVGSLLWWLALCFGAALVRQSFEPRHLKWINRGSGVLLLLTAVGLVVTLFLPH